MIAQILPLTALPMPEPKARLRALQQAWFPVGTGIAIAWATGSFPQTIVLYAYQVLIFRYLTDTVGIAVALVGTMVALSKLYDALIDPLIGVLADRIDTPMGKRRPWMLAGGVFMAGSLVLGFNIPLGEPADIKIIWACVGLFLFSSGFSLFSIPWLAMPQEISAVAHDRTRMMAWRVGCSSVGQGAASLSGPVLLSALGMGAFAYSTMGWVMGALCLGGALLTVYLTRNAPMRAVESLDQPGFREQARLVIENKPFLVLILVKICIYFGLALNASAMALLTKWVYGFSDYWLGAYFMITTVSLVGSQPLWLWCSARFGNKGALAIAIALHACAQISLYFNNGSEYLLAGQALVLGAGAGGVFMLTQALLPDVIEEDYRRTGLRRGGVFAGIVALLETSSSALAIFAMGLLLAASGYAEGAGAGGVQVQPQSALDAIRKIASIFPALAEFLAIAMLSRFHLRTSAQSEERP